MFSFRSKALQIQMSTCVSMGYYKRMESMEWIKPFVCLKKCISAFDFILKMNHVRGLQYQSLSRSAKISLPTFSRVIITPRLEVVLDTCQLKPRYSKVFHPLKPILAEGPQFSKISSPLLCSPEGDEYNKAFCRPIRKVPNGYQWEKSLLMVERPGMHQDRLTSWVEVVGIVSTADPGVFKTLEAIKCISWV